MTKEARPICEGCKNEFDPDVCWCGVSMSENAHDSHTPVPMGCDCYRAKADHSTHTEHNL